MQKNKRQIAETLDFIKGKLKQAPYIGLLTGTGLNASVECMTIDTVIDYKDIPHFPTGQRQVYGRGRGRGAVPMGGLGRGRGAGACMWPWCPCPWPPGPCI